MQRECSVIAILFYPRIWNRILEIEFSWELQWMSLSLSPGLENPGPTPCNLPYPALFSPSPFILLFPLQLIQLEVPD